MSPHLMALQHGGPPEGGAAWEALLLAADAADAADATCTPLPARGEQPGTLSSPLLA